MTDQSQDLELIKETVQFYFDGMFYGDMDKLTKAFHKEAFLIGHFHGTFNVMPVQGFIDMLAPATPPSTKGEAFDMEILTIDITGQVAAVKVRDVYGKMSYIDYLNLAKVEGTWMIVNKTYHHD